jgi:class 3 adenylate cyclase
VTTTGDLPASVRSILRPRDANVDRSLDFARDVRALIFARLKVAGIAHAGVHGLALVLLVAMDPANALRYSVDRAIGVAFALTFAAFGYVPKLERFAFGLSVALTLGTAAYIVLPLWLYGLAQGYDPGGVVLLIVATGLLFPYTLRRMLLVCGAITAMSIAGALAHFETRQLGNLVEGSFYLLAASAIATVGARLAYRMREREFRAREELEAQRAASEELLLNVLPQSIVERLKRDQSAIADGFLEATVLFADIVGFTPLSAKLPPGALVRMLNEVFSKFDELTEKHGLEKIKTIGDAYMVVGGAPTPRRDHAAAVANLALEMRAATGAFTTPTGEPLQIRVGINTGPVVAGVIGTKKFSYDLWGDTVNTAARMEAYAEPSTIQVTERTYERLRQQFQLEARGTLDVKGKGEMRTFVLLGPRRSLRPPPIP